MSEPEAKPKLSRRGRINLGIFRFMAIITFGMPFVVVAAYYLIGWQVAVLAFPLLLFAILSGSRRRVQDRPKTAGFRRILIALALSAIPIAAVAVGNTEIMRLWAYAMAIPLAISMGLDPRAAQNLTADRLNVPVRWTRVAHLALWTALAGLFVAGSELVWLKTSLGAWIWYHAFGVPIFMALMLVLYGIVERIVRPKPKRATYDVDPPAASADDAPQSAGAASRWPSLNMGLRYGPISPSQAQTIAADRGLARSALVEKTHLTLDQIPEPEFVLLFLGSQITLVPGDDPEHSVEWHFTEAPAGMQVMGKIHMFKAQSVPRSLTPDLIAAAYVDDWEALETLLSPHIYFRKTA